MARVLVTAEVKDLAKWEDGFRTHGDLFKKQTVNKAIHFATTGKNKVVVLFEPDDLDTYMQILDSPATAEAMDSDGIKRETVTAIVLDKVFDPS